MTPPARLATLDTQRLQLRASEPDLAPAVSAFFQRNREAHAPWNPPAPEGLFSVEGQLERLARSAAAADAGAQIDWWLVATDQPANVLGKITLSQIARGSFQNAMLGYAIDKAHEGRGLMREALLAALADAFGPRVHLHRIQANVRPENTRSLALLDRLGFEREGLAREYLYIDGAWRDHVMTALRHPDWVADPSLPN